MSQINKNTEGPQEFGPGSPPVVIANVLIQDFEERIEELRREVEVLRAENEALRAELDVLKASVKADLSADPTGDLLS